MPRIAVLLRRRGYAWALLFPATWTVLIVLSVVFVYQRVVMPGGFLVLGESNGLSFLTSLCHGGSLVVPDTAVDALIQTDLDLVLLRSTRNRSRPGRVGTARCEACLQEGSRSRHQQPEKWTGKKSVVKIKR